MFHSLIPLKNVQIFNGNVKYKSFNIKWVDNWPLFNIKKKILVDLFWACFDILPGTKCSLGHQTCTYFHSCFFLTFPFFYLYKKFKLSIKNYFLLIYTFMCIIIFLRIIILSVQSHQTQKNACTRYGLYCIFDMAPSRRTSLRSWRRPWRTRFILYIVQYMCIIDVWV